MKDDGYSAVSEISWLTDTGEDEIEQYWVNAYSKIDAIKTSSQLLLEQRGIHNDKL